MESIPYLVEIPFFLPQQLDSPITLCSTFTCTLELLKAQGHMNCQPMVQKYHATSHVLYSDYF